MAGMRGRCTVIEEKIDDEGWVRERVTVKQNFDGSTSTTTEKMIEGAEAADLLDGLGISLSINVREAISLLKDFATKEPIGSDDDGSWCTLCGADKYEMAEHLPTCAWLRAVNLIGGK